MSYSIFCNNGCNVVQVSTPDETDECAACGGLMSIDGEDGFYFHRETVPIFVANATEHQIIPADVPKGKQDKRGSLK